MSASFAGSCLNPGLISRPARGPKQIIRGTPWKVAGAIADAGIVLVPGRQVGHYRGRMKRATILKRLRRNARLIDAHTHEGIDPVFYVRGDFPYALSGEDLMLRLAARGVDAAAELPNCFVDVSAAPDTEINEFRKLPGTVQRRIGRANTLRFLGG